MEQRVRAVVGRYEDEPVEVEVGDIPELVAELEVGRTDAVASFLSQDRSNEHFFSDGMFYALVCHDEISFADPAEVEGAVPADPFGLQDRFEFGSNVGTEAFATCSAFDSGQAAPEANQPVESDVPTLLMAGEFDPVTPPEWARVAAVTLSGSHLVVAPDAAHGVSTDECGMSIVLAFLDDPVAPPDTACLAESEVRFLVGPPAETALEANVQVDTCGPYDIQVGDKFLLCSDGLTGRVVDRELGAVVNHLPGQEACQVLVDLANLSGGIDNITIILVQIGDPENRGPFKPAAAESRFNGKRLWTATHRKLGELRRWYRQRGQERGPEDLCG